MFHAVSAIICDDDDDDGGGGGGYEGVARKSSLPRAGSKRRWDVQGSDEMERARKTRRAQLERVVPEAPFDVPVSAAQWEPMVASEELEDVAALFSGLHALRNADGDDVAVAFPFVSGAGGLRVVAVGLQPGGLAQVCPIELARIKSLVNAVGSMRAQDLTGGEVRSVWYCGAGEMVTMMPQHQGKPGRAAPFAAVDVDVVSVDPGDLHAAALVAFPSTLGRLPVSSARQLQLLLDSAWHIGPAQTPMRYEVSEDATWAVGGFALVDGGGRVLLRTALFPMLVGRSAKRVGRAVPRATRRAEHPVRRASPPRQQRGVVAARAARAAGQEVVLHLREPGRMHVRLTLPPPRYPVPVPHDMGSMPLMTPPARFPSAMLS